jgi:hypothetical protein
VRVKADARSTRYQSRRGVANDRNAATPNRGTGAVTFEVALFEGGSPSLLCHQVVLCLRCNRVVIDTLGRDQVATDSNSGKA